MKWFRFYNEDLNDPKVQKLEPESFKFWVNILCIASKNDGKLPSVEDIAYLTRASILATEQLLSSLKSATLVHEKSNQHGTWLAPYEWHKKQYKSDTSTHRVKRFRNVSETPNETPPETETDTDTDTDKKKTIKKEKSQFEIFWKEYGRIGNKQQANKSFDKSLKNGASYAEIINGLGRYQAQCRAENRESKYIKHAATWLNNRGWDDEYPIYQTAPKLSKSDELDEVLFRTVNKIAAQENGRNFSDNDS